MRRLYRLLFNYRQYWSFSNPLKLPPRYEYLIYDPELIERELLAQPSGHSLALRFMPRSFDAWRQKSQLLIGNASPDPQLIRHQFFLREPHSDLEKALKEARARGVLVFLVIYDPAHPTRSKLDWALGYFMEYQATKRLVDQHFVPVLGPSTDPSLSKLVPEDDPLELCLWVVLNADGEVLRRERVYANPDEGLKRVRAIIAEHETSGRGTSRSP